MIRVTVELISGVDRSHKKVLGIAEIVNDGKQTRASGGKLGSYNVKLSKWEPETDKVWRRGFVYDFEREKRGGWDLLFMALLATVGFRNWKKRST